MKLKLATCTLATSDWKNPRTLALLVVTTLSLATGAVGYTVSAVTTSAPLLLRPLSRDQNPFLP